MKQFLFTLAFAFLLMACNEKQVEEKVSVQAHEEKEDAPKRLLMHDVYLNLKDSVSEAEVDFAIKQLKRLDALETTFSVHTGKRANTGDTRLNKDYDLALHVVFTSLDKLHEYEKDSIHADVRAQLKDLLAGPPVVFDYWTE